ncbi:signal peptidase II [Labrys portucalensis]|uniref:Lipoprotein signal peptidase n=1 Tax=Labrys neptuniae TaxID=376174 RepID=A0ABV3PLQ0_9HYPH|nr:signal peptidase II [Labrys neptuniae]MDT3382174.1 signal peptidase II [Labrys neptuniae]
MKSMFFGRYTLIGVMVAVLAIIIDQGFKYWALHIFQIGELIMYQEAVDWTPFLKFTLVWNRGVSFGLFQQESEIGLILLVAFRLIATVLLLAWLARIHTKSSAIGIGLIIGGAIGNAVDGLLAIEGPLAPNWLQREGVADFFLLHAGDFSWYVFNLADVAIVAGVALLLYDMVVNKEPQTHGSS